MQTIQINDEIKPFSLKFTITNIQGETTTGLRKEDFLTFKQSTADYLLPHWMKKSEDKSSTLLGILCSVDPSQDKKFKKM